MKWEIVTMFKCPTCGNLSNNNDKYCGECTQELEYESIQVQAKVKPEIAEELKKAVQRDRREIIELLENYLLDTNHCFEIEKLKFVNKLSFADLILSIARGLIYGK